MARHPSIQLFAGLFALSLLLSGAIAYQVTSRMTFAFAIPPEAATTLIGRIQMIRAISLGLAMLLMLFVVFAASRVTRSALALRWIVGVATSVALLRGAGLIDHLPHHDTALIAVSALQLSIEALAILLLYGDDANEWFAMRR